jgi:hypothetical protein
MAAAAAEIFINCLRQRRRRRLDFFRENQRRLSRSAYTSNLFLFSFFLLSSYVLHSPSCLLYEHILSSLIFTIHTHVFQFLPVF